MKKYLLLTLVTLSALFLNSCEKYCACTMPGSDQPQTIEIQPTERCASYSGSDNGECGDK